MNFLYRPAIRLDQAAKMRLVSAMGKQLSFHESFDREEEIAGSSDRSFGLVFAGFCGIVSAIKWWFGIAGFQWWLLAAVAFLAFAFIYPRALGPLNKLWMKFGLVLYRIINPVILALMFFVCIMPIGLLMRACGKDPLRKRAHGDTFWVARSPPGPAPESMKHQF